MRTFAGSETKFRQLVPIGRALDIERASCINAAPEFAHLGCIAPNQIKYKAFEVGCLGDIHRRAAGVIGVIRRARAIDAGSKKFIQYIVFVSGKDKLADGQAHHARNVASADVTEITRRHRKCNLLIVGLRRGKVALEVIDDLRRHARPVDRIDRADFIFGLEGVIIGHRLDQILRLVKHATDGDVEDVWILQ